MSYKIMYFDEVNIDVKEARAWYKEQQNGLQLRFVAAIKATILRIKENPTAFTVRYKNVRVAHPDVFPYGVHFFIDDTAMQIIIIAIIHNSRSPKIPKQRI